MPIFRRCSKFAVWPLFLVLSRSTSLIINVFFIPCIQVVLAHIATYLAQAPKSIAVYSAYKRAKSVMKECMGGQPGVPLHLRNAPTILMRDLDYGKEYKYTPDFSEEDGKQDYMPKELLGTNFFEHCN